MRYSCVLATRAREVALDDADVVSAVVGGATELELELLGAQIMERMLHSAEQEEDAVALAAGERDLVAVVAVVAVAVAAGERDLVAVVACAFGERLRARLCCSLDRAVAGDRLRALLCCAESGRAVAPVHAIVRVGERARAAAPAATETPLMSAFLWRQTPFRL